MSLKHKYFECSCNSSEHLLRFSYFDDERDALYVETLFKRHPWYKRIWYSLLYILGKPSKYGNWSETVLDLGTAAELHDFLHEVLDA